MPTGPFRAFAALLALLWFGAPAVAAYGGDLFRVQLMASAEAESGVAAKEKAMSEALTKAATRVISRLVRQRDMQRIGVPEGASLDRMVSSIQVRGEQVSPTGYSANLVVTFSEASVLGRIRRSGAPVITLQAPGTLLMPVVTDGRGVINWHDQRWHRLWRARADPNGIVPMTVFSRSAEDRSYFASMESAVDETILALMSLRYGAENAAIVIAGPTEDGVGLLVTVRGFDGRGSFALKKTYTGLRGVPSSAMEEAVPDIIALLEDRWKVAVVGGGLSAPGFEAATVRVGGTPQMVEVPVPVDQIDDPALLAVVEDISGVLKVNRSSSGAMLEVAFE
ncbi:MAG: DUF2066 domain-containing protein, partial [Pseudomonadota bacterium]